jgi:hypothetical protein
VLLPLGTNRLLVGGAHDYAPSLERLPLEIARCSSDYFISSSNSDQNAQLPTEFDTNTELMSIAEMGTIMDKVMSQ